MATYFPGQCIAVSDAYANQLAMGARQQQEQQMAHVFTHIHSQGHVHEQYMPDSMWRNEIVGEIEEKKLTFKQGLEAEIKEWLSDALV